jgi:Na+-driven multidrug efflux pump
MKTRSLRLMNLTAIVINVAIPIVLASIGAHLILWGLPNFLAAATAAAGWIYIERMWKRYPNPHDR